MSFRVLSYDDHPPKSDIHYHKADNHNHKPDNHNHNHNPDDNDYPSALSFAFRAGSLANKKVGAIVLRHSKTNIVFPHLFKLAKVSELQPYELEALHTCALIAFPVIREFLDSYPHTGTREQLWAAVRATLIERLECVDAPLGDPLKVEELHGE